MKSIASFQETLCLELELVEHCIPSRQHPSVNGGRNVPSVLWMEIHPVSHVQDRRSSLLPTLPAHHGCALSHVCCLGLSLYGVTVQVTIQM